MTQATATVLNTPIGPIEEVPAETPIAAPAAAAPAPKAKRVRKPKATPVTSNVPAPADTVPTSEPAAPEATPATSGKKGKTMTATATKKAPTKKTKKGAKKAAAKSNGAPRAKKDGLRKPQIRILAALNKHGELTRGKISEKAPVDLAALTEYIGSDDAAIRKANDAKHFPSLLGLGFVSAASYPDKDGHDGPTEYKITASGKKALADSQKE